MFRGFKCAVIISSFTLLFMAGCGDEDENSTAYCADLAKTCALCVGSPTAIASKPTCDTTVANGNEAACLSAKPAFVTNGCK